MIAQSMARDCAIAGPASDWRGQNRDRTGTEPGQNQPAPEPHVPEQMRWIMDPEGWKPGVIVAQGKA